MMLRFVVLFAPLEWHVAGIAAMVAVVTLLLEGIGAVLVQARDATPARAGRSDLSPRRERCRWTCACARHPAT